MSAGYPQAHQKMDTPATRLRALLQASNVTVPASVFDPFSAKMAENLQFPLMQLAGSVASNVILGKPDLLLITLTEFSDLCRRLTRNVSIPLLVDADNGFGNALNVQRCVNELANSGVAGLTIEDSDLPGRFGASTKPVAGSAGAFSLTSIEEHVCKLESAILARKQQNCDICVFARTSAYAVGGISELVKRLESYSKISGLDGLHLIGTPEAGEWEAIKNASNNLPIVCSGKQNLGDSDLADFNVRLRLGAHKPWLCAVNAAYESLKVQKEKNGDEPTQIDGEIFRKLVDVDETNEVQTRYLKVAKPCEGVKGKPKQVASNL